MLLGISHVTRLEVKWANIHRGDEQFYQKPHYNPYYQLILISDGPVYLQINDKKLTLDAGECVLFRPWEQHQGWKKIGDSAGFFWCQFSADPISLTLEDTDELRQDVQFTGNAQADLRTSTEMNMNVLLPTHIRLSRRYEFSLIFEKLVKGMQRPQGYFRLQSSLSLWNMLHMLAEELLEQSQVTPSLPASFIIYRQIVNYLEESYSSDISKEALESTINRTYEHICSVFKKYSGTTISLYMQQLRLQRAKYLLLNSSKPMNDIAFEIGFSDPYYFSRVFKKTFGVSPIDFRNMEDPRKV